MARHSLLPDEDAIAFVVQTRPYPAGDVLTSLIRRRMTVSERPATPDTVDAIRQARPDLVVLAIDPADQDDRTFVETVSKTSGDTIVFLLAPAIDPVAIAEALRLGADVWLTDADCPDVFESQVGAIRRRLEEPVPESAQADVLESGPLRLDLRSYRATINDVNVNLTPLEFRILWYLVSREGAVVTPGEILSNAQAGDYPEAQARDTMKVHVRRIRTKLAALLPDAEMILNLRGIGYLFEKPEDGALLTRRRRSLGHKPRVASG